MKLSGFIAAKGITMDLIAWQRKGKQADEYR